MWCDRRSLIWILHLALGETPDCIGGSVNDLLGFLGSSDIPCDRRAGTLRCSKTIEKGL
jgi:hypothetical protein